MSEQDMVAFDVFIEGKWIDRVYFEFGTEKEYARTTLIEHGGYDPRIALLSRGRREEGCPKKN
jgi:hypothetical protein